MKKLRYTEKKIDFYFNNVIEFLIVILKQILFSPYLLINEISKKIPFIPKLINPLLLGSLGFSIAITFIEIIVQLINFNFSLLRGNKPLIINIISIIILFILLIYYQYHSSALDQLEKLIKHMKDTNEKNEKIQEKIKNAETINLVKDKVDSKEENNNTKQVDDFDQQIDNLYNDNDSSFDSLFDFNNTSLDDFLDNNNIDYMNNNIEYNDDETLTDKNDMSFTDEETTVLQEIMKDGSNITNKTLDNFIDDILTKDILQEDIIDEIKIDFNDLNDLNDVDI